MTDPQNKHFRKEGVRRPGVPKNVPGPNEKELEEKLRPHGEALERIQEEQEEHEDEALGSDK